MNAKWQTANTANRLECKWKKKIIYTPPFVADKNRTKKYKINENNNNNNYNIKQCARCVRPVITPRFDIM